MPTWDHSKEMGWKSWSRGVVLVEVAMTAKMEPKERTLHFLLPQLLFLPPSFPPTF